MDLESLKKLVSIYGITLYTTENNVSKDDKRGRWVCKDDKTVLDIFYHFYYVYNEEREIIGKKLYLRYFYSERKISFM